MPGLTSDLPARLRVAERLVDQRTGEARAIGLRGKEVMERSITLREQIAQLDRVTGVLTSLGDTRQEEAQSTLEAIVTQGLRAIFGEDISFHLVTSARGKQSTVDFMVRSSHVAPDGSVEAVETSVMDARGGGMASVVGFLLRLTVMLLTPGARRLMILDETFGMVSEDYEAGVGEFLREVCDRTGTQILLVTHSLAYTDLADRVYRLSLDSSGATQVRETNVSRKDQDGTRSNL